MFLLLVRAIPFNPVSQMMSELPESLVSLRPINRRQLLSPQELTRLEQQQQLGQLPVLREEHSWGSSSLTNALLDYEFAFSDLPEADHWVSPVYLPFEDERGPFGKTEQVIVA